MACFRRTCVVGMIALASAGAAPFVHPAISADELKELGTSPTSRLTPMGAERAGNPAGTIPAWTGGLKEPPPGVRFERGRTYGDPFADDQPLFTITGDNWEKYKDHLSAGQIAMLKQYPTFKMPVYQSRRTALFPQKHYEQTRECAQRAVMATDNNGVSGCKGGVPFPVPRNGHEVMWNHNLRYWGDTFETQFVHIAPTRAGEYTATEFEFQADFHYGNLSLPASEVIPNRRVNYMQTVTAPARLAGEVILIHENVDFSKEARSAWIYNPGQRRVRLAPTVAFDNPIVGGDGQRTVDDGFMFNGSLERYDWKLIGKKEMYVPYNSYKLASNSLKYADVVKPGHLNPDYLRYELHRMWVVEATLRPGTSHLYAKRVMYVDEDSWMVTLTDKYDERGTLWRTAENHSITLYDMNLYFPMVDVHYDLLNGRYIAMGLRNEKSTIYMPTRKTAADFTPQALRGLGVR